MAEDAINCALYEKLFFFKAFRKTSAKKTEKGLLSPYRKQSRSFSLDRDLESAVQSTTWRVAHCIITRFSFSHQGF